MTSVFWGTRVLEVVKKHDSGGLVWKRIKLTTTCKANAKKRLLRVWQNEAIFRACAETPSQSYGAATVEVSKKENTDNLLIKPSSFSKPALSDGSNQKGAAAIQKR
ncbi:hypothetical protein ACFX11_034151 [Malus domestica]